MSEQNEKLNTEELEAELQQEHDEHKVIARRQLIISSVFGALIILATIGVILYGKGYRIGLNKGTANLSKTGILNASSTPKGAEVYVNGHLTTATNNTVNLTPGKYTVSINEDGYNGWQKDVQIQA